MDSAQGPSGDSSQLGDSSPHDTYAKYTFGEPRRAADALAAALGPDRAALIDWSTLEPAPAALSDKALRHLYPDLRFRARAQGREVRVDVIFEHQSDVDPIMPARFLCEVGALWTQARRDGRPRVPFVWNVVLYNGEQPWRSPREMWCAIEDGAYYRDRVPDLLPAAPFVVEDLAALSDAEILKRPYRPETMMALLTLKHARRDESVDLLRRVGSLLPGLSDDFLRQSVTYMLRVDRSVEPEQVAEVLEPVLGSRGREIPMTAGDRLISLGEARGEARGEAKGEERAHQRLISAFLQAVRGRGVRLTDEELAIVEATTDPTEILRWNEGMAGGRSLHDILAERAH